VVWWRKKPVPQWFYRQPGVIPCRVVNEEIEVLLITSRSGKRWIIPKGVVEPGMSPAESAAKEALEEAGVEGEISAAPSGEYEYPKWGGVCKVEVYLLKVTTIHPEWPEKYFRERRWVSAEEAARLVREPELKNLFLALLRRQE